MNTVDRPNRDALKGVKQTRVLEALVIHDWQPETNRNLL